MGCVIEKKLCTINHFLDADNTKKLVHVSLLYFVQICQKMSDNLHASLFH